LRCTSTADFVDGLGLDIRRDAAVLTWRREEHRASWLGTLPQAHGVALGVAPPQGRLTPAMLRGARALPANWAMAACV
jgi:precorrin-3B synthase